MNVSPRRIAGLLSAIAALALSAPSAAQQAVPEPAQGFGIEVNPAKVDFELPTGAKYTMPMQVKNPGEDVVHVVVTPTDFKLNLKGDYEFLKVGESAYSLMKYATVNPREFDIPGGTTQQVQVTFTMPAGAKAIGENAGILFFQTRPPRKGRPTLTFSTRIATKFYCTIKDTGKMAGEVTNVTSARSVNGQEYQITFRNTGNQHVYLGGYVEVKRGGETVDKITIPGGQLVERGSDRLIAVTGKRLPPGSYQAVAAVDYGGRKLTGGAIAFNAQ